MLKAILTHFQLYSLLTGTDLTIRNNHLFVVHHITHPKSGDQVLLVSAPNSGYVWDAQIKEGLQHILPHINQKQIRFTAHVWIHDITQSYLLHDDGKPQKWDALKTIFEGMVEMNQVMFLSTRWDKAKVGTGEKEEKKIQKALREDTEKGLGFEQLRRLVLDDAWGTMDRICGRCFMNRPEDEKEDNSLIKRRLENEVDWEYMMYRKKMWTLFEECGFLKILVGQYLKEFYGFEVFPEPPKKSIFERILKRVKN
ncbi:hypothetical protein AN958_07389 [Leucoagaricus sp. SymC.cos]|nr:hypothetical protein AN958_07389 [Leucoagaricus sp. SymC.cos]